MAAPRMAADTSRGADWTVERKHPDSFVIRFDFDTAQEAWALCMSDEHWDNAHCDRALLKRHHEEALERNAPVLKIGDLFCAMQGKWDQRSDQNELRPEHRGNKYLDSLVSTAGDWYAPYAKSIALVTPGNHEGSILKRHQTDLTQRLMDRLRAAGSPGEVGAYRGFVRFAFKQGRWQDSRVMCWHHGYGGGGEVTRGMIDNSRTRDQYLADLYYSGHIHRSNGDRNALTYLSQSGVVSVRNQFFLRGGAYKIDHEGAWHIGRGGAARPLGGWWIRFSVRVVDGNRTLVVAPSWAL